MARVPPFSLFFVGWAVPLSRRPDPRSELRAAIRAGAPKRGLGAVRVGGLGFDFGRFSGNFETLLWDSDVLGRLGFQDTFFGDQHRSLCAKVLHFEAWQD